MSNPPAQRIGRAQAQLKTCFVERLFQTYELDNDFSRSRCMSSLASSVRTIGALSARGSAATRHLRTPPRKIGAHPRIAHLGRCECRSSEIPVLLLEREVLTRIAPVA
jgi:hypothetical protein